MDSAEGHPPIEISICLSINDTTGLRVDLRVWFSIFFFQAEDGIRDPLWSRGLGDVYKRQRPYGANFKRRLVLMVAVPN